MSKDDALADEGPIADAARSIASWCDGDARINVYKAAKRILSATRLEALQAQPVGEGVEQGARGLARFYHPDADQDATSPPLWLSYLGEANAVLQAAALTSSPPVVEREAIARIIAPSSFVNEGSISWNERGAGRRNALAKADAILALTPVEGVGERSPELVEVIREWLMSTDHAVSDWECQFAEAIRSMMRASGWTEPNALSTPVAQGDEVRDASTKMQHVAYFDDGEFHWMSGIKSRDCELYAPFIATITKGARDAGW